MSKDLILIVDDDEATRSSLEIVLNAEGYETICAVDGTDALTQLTSHQPAAILLDIMMLPMPGMVFLRRLRDLGLAGKYPIIVMTAMLEINETLRKMQRESEILDFLVKPLDQNTIAKITLLLKDLNRIVHVTSETRVVDNATS